MRQAPVTIQIAPHASFRDPFLDGGSCCFCSGSRPHGNLDTDPGTGTLRPHPLWEVMSSSILLLCCSATCCRASRPCSRSTNDSRSFSRRLYGPGCRATACLIAPPCLGISLLSIKRVWRRSGRYAQKDVLARKPFPSPGGLFDRTDQPWIVIDVDGTRQAARQRALPQTDRLPTPHRRFDQVCAPGYQGRKRGEVVRTRTVVREKHTHQFLGTQIERRVTGTTAAICDGPPR